jgi:hypothetical protein
MSCTHLRSAAESDVLSCAGTLAEFEAVLAEAPGDAIAANNAAICHMYACDLASAVALLEGALRGQPRQLLRETLLLNLCSMYDLSSSTASTESKRRLTAWAAGGPDDFDLSIFRPS